MKRIISLCVCLVLIGGLEMGNPSLLLAQEEPILEEYAISHSGTLGTIPGFEAQLFDLFLGNGTAKSRIRFKITDDAGVLSLRVWRRVTRRQIVFALLVFRVEIRGFDSTSALVYSRDLEGFTFGDSRSGNWVEELRGLPTDIQQIKITFFGNYE